MNEVETNIPTEEIEGPANKPSLARIGMWIFISTEAMFFAALLAIYLVMRLNTLGVGWPQPHLMHVNIATGILNTLILVFSGLTCWQCVQNSRMDKPHSAKLWLIATIVLGSCFLVVRGFEYRSKFDIGLVPISGKKQVYHRPDYDYLAAVNERMNLRIRELEESIDRAGRSPTASEVEYLDILYELKTYLTEHTSRRVGRLDNSYDRQMAIRLMAYQIYPHPDTAHGIDEFLGLETGAISTSIKILTIRQERIADRQRIVARQIEDLQNEIEGLELIGSGQVGQKEELEEKKRWYEVKKVQAANLEYGADEVARRLEPMEGRMNCLTRLSDMPEGVNSALPVRLPVVITNGSQWISAYFLLTGAHAIHVVGGLIVFLVFLPRRLDASRAHTMHVVGIYWQFVDIVWLTIFWLIYF